MELIKQTKIKFLKSLCTVYLLKIHEVGGHRLVESIRWSHNPSIISLHSLVLRES